MQDLGNKTHFKTRLIIRNTHCLKSHHLTEAFQAETQVFRTEEVGLGPKRSVAIQRKWVASQTMASFEEAMAAAAWRPVNVPQQTNRSVGTEQRMPPQRSYGKLCSPLDWPPDPSDVFRRRTSESLHTSADWNIRLAPPGLFRSVPRITNETHERLMSEVEAGTANSAARYYAEIVERNREHARRTGGICPSPPRCPGSPLTVLPTIQRTFSSLTLGGASISADKEA